MSSKSGKLVAINVNVDIEKKGGGSYKGWQLIFTLPNGKIETVAKHINSLKFVPGLQSSLDNLVAGDDVTITFEKKGEFNEVVSIVKGLADTSVASSGTTITKVVGSNYETKEERATKQRLIVRQSCLAQAVAYYNGYEPPHADASEVLEIANTFCNWVLENNKDAEVV